MPAYKLTYFNIRARGEPIRVILKLAGVEYEETTIPWASEEWARLKKDGSKCQFGQLPTLEVNGVKLSHSMAILRYLGKELGYAPDNNLQQAQADAIVDQCQDIVDKFIWIYFHEQDPEKKEIEKKNWLEKTVAEGLAGFERTLKRNGTGYFVTDKITYAEVAFFCTFNDYLAKGKTDIPAQFNDFPLTSTLYRSILNEPNIASHIKNRPVTIV